MKLVTFVCLCFLFQINLAYFSNNEIDNKYTNKSYFAVIGITGEGKSLFVNKLSEQSKFTVSSDGNSETQKIQDVEFDFNGNSLIAIDTPGLDDSLYNKEKIKQLKKLIYDYPTLKTLIIVKKYNNFRLSECLQQAIETFMDSFPLENFWDHVIIVNTWANPKDENYLNYYNHKKQYFVDKVNNCQNLKDYMYRKRIKIPYQIKEYFIDSEDYDGNEKMKEIFNQIKKDIISNELMFKKVERGEIETSVEKSGKNDIYIVKEFRRIICTDFKDQKKEIIENIGEREEELSDLNKIKTIIDKEYLLTDDTRLYDYLSLGLTWSFRTKYLYRVYETGVHKIGNKEFKGYRKHIKDVWES